MKRDVKIFVSYSHRNKSVLKLIDLLMDHFKAANKYNIKLWIDKNLQIGGLWESEIKDEIDNCDLALLMLSPSFLSSAYIMDKEVPRILEKSKPFMSIAVAKLSHKNHDFKGLDKYQYFRLDSDGFLSPRSFSELSNKKREDEFAFEVFELIMDKLDNIFTIE